MSSTSKTNTKYIIIISILIVIIIGLLTYLVIDKNLIFKNSTKVEEKKVKVKNKLDLTKCLNTTYLTYINPSSKESDYGLSMKINIDKKSITLSINVQSFGSITTEEEYAIFPAVVEDYQIIGFNKKIKSTFVGDITQDYKGITLFFVMEDGSVEYMPMFGREENQDGLNFKTSGTIPNVENVYKLYTTDVYGRPLYRNKTTIAVKKDGSFYDLGAIINGNSK